MPRVLAGAGPRRKWQDARETAHVVPHTSPGQMNSVSTEPAPVATAEAHPVEQLQVAGVRPCGRPYAAGVGGVAARLARRDEREHAPASQQAARAADLPPR